MPHQNNLHDPSSHHSINPEIPGGYFCELKIDGLAVSLIYRDGLFVRGATRGDGRVGEDVTLNLKTIEAIPLKLNFQEGKVKIKNELVRLPREIEVRGEVFMTNQVFENLNKKYRQEGRPLLANPRNAAAGSIRQLDPKIAASRKLSFIAWDLLPHPRGGVKMVRTHQEAHLVLRELGFKTILQNRPCRILAEVEDFKKEIEKIRENLPFQIDGIVVVINDNKLREKLGVVGKAPRGMVAYKFAPEEATTIVEDIQVQVGRTGTLTPVAVLKPILVAGSTISRATLHNEDEIKKKDVRIGDTVVVHKAGDVIPEVAKVIKELRSGKEKTFYFPSKCPQCGGRVVREPGKAAYRCTNKKCFIVQRRALEHFVSKPAFDINGLGPKILAKFIEEGLVKDASDLFDLKIGDIEPLERFAPKSAQNIVKAIAPCKTVELSRLIYALGIANVGEQTAYDMAEVIKSKTQSSKSKNYLAKLQSMTFHDWQEIKDIGPVVAQSIYNYFQDQKNQRFIRRLLEVVQIKNFKPADKLKGQVFVFTGGLKNYSRDEAKKIVRDLGGKTSESVGQETNFVVSGSEPGEKYDQARQLGKKIISEKEFLKLVK